MNKYQIKKNQSRQITLEEPGEYRIELVGEGAEVNIAGVFVGREDEEKRVKIEVVHKAAHTRANTVLKGAAYDKSLVRFEGRIIVEKDCPDTNSFLTEKILLLSDDARAEAVPDLEIESDDVKCSHAATVSQIDEGQIFYLMSRGLSKKKAKGMIVEGFLGELS